MKPKFMLNDAPVTSPTQCTIVGPIRKYTIDSFQGGAPTATIEVCTLYVYVCIISYVHTALEVCRMCSCNLMLILVLIMAEYIRVCAHTVYPNWDA